MSLKQTVNLLTNVKFARVDTWHSFSSLLSIIFVFFVLSIFLSGGLFFYSFYLDSNLQERAILLKASDAMVDAKKRDYADAHGEVMVEYKAGNLEASIKRKKLIMENLSNIEYEKAYKFSDILTFIAQSYSSRISIKSLVINRGGRGVSILGFAIGVDDIFLFRDVLQTKVDFLGLVLEDLKIEKVNDFYQFSFNTRGFDAS